MGKFKCTICEYFHTGENPPKKCPVCGADETNFKKIKPKQK